MASGDGAVRRCYPIFAASICDYMDQIATVGCKMGECPICTVSPDSLGDNVKFPIRNLKKVLAALSVYDEKPENFLQACQDAGVNAIIHPFWKDLPYCNIYLCITPNILHQLL